MKNFINCASSVAKKLFILCVMLGAVVLTSCKSAKDKLDASAKEAAKSCPVHIDKGMVCTDIFVEGSNVVYKIEIDEYTAGFNASDLDDPTAYSIVKQAMLGDLRHSPDSDLKELIKLLKEADYNLIYRFVGTYYDETRDIVIYGNEI